MDVIQNVFIVDGSENIEQASSGLNANIQYVNLNTVEFGFEEF